jgi:hypothetical protein
LDGNNTSDITAFRLEVLCVGVFEKCATFIRTFGGKEIERNDMETTRDTVTFTPTNAQRFVKHELFNNSWPTCFGSVWPSSGH